MIYKLSIQICSTSWTSRDDNCISKRLAKGRHWYTFAIGFDVGCCSCDDLRRAPEMTEGYVLYWFVGGIDHSDEAVSINLNESCGMLCRPRTAVGVVRYAIF